MLQYDKTLKPEEMKAQMNTRKGISKSLTFAAMIFAATLAANAGEAKNSKNCEAEAAMISLEKLNTKIEQLVRYTAPAVYENLEVADASERLELLASAIEKEVRYTAPEVDEAASTREAEERLEDMIAAVEEAVKFRAPEVAETGNYEEVEVALAYQRLEDLFASVEATVKYQVATAVENAEADNKAEENATCEFWQMAMNY
jgi:hypothetical protein